MHARYRLNLYDLCYICIIYFINGVRNVNCVRTTIVLEAQYIYLYSY